MAVRVGVWGLLILVLAVVLVVLAVVLPLALRRRKPPAGFPVIPPMVPPGKQDPRPKEP